MNIYSVAWPNITSLIKVQGEASNDAESLWAPIVAITQAAYRKILTNPDTTYIQIQKIDELLATYPTPEYPLIMWIEKKPLSVIQEEIMEYDSTSIIIYRKYVKSLCIEFKRKLEIALAGTAYSK